MIRRSDALKAACVAEACFSAVEAYRSRAYFSSEACARVESEVCRAYDQGMRDCGLVQAALSAYKRLVDSWESQAKRRRSAAACNPKFSAMVERLAKALASV